MSSAPLTAAALLGATVLAACNSDDPRTAPPAERATTTSSPAPPGRTIPDGIYAKTVSRAEARASGIRDTNFLGELGEDGATTYAFKFAGDRWTVFIVEDGSAPEPGDLGTFEYDDDGDVVMVSESAGCPGCVVTYDWELTGERLSLTIVGHESTGGPEDLAVVRFVTEGDFTRQS